MIKLVENNLFYSWLVWHFKDAPLGILNGWKNFLKFSLDFFSIFPLLKTLFAPWKRISESYEGLGDLTQSLEAFILNSFSRFLGFLVRSFLILIGVFFTSIIFIVGAFIFLIWFFVPILILFGLIVSFALII